MASLLWRTSVLLTVGAVGRNASASQSPRLEQDLRQALGSVVAAQGLPGATAAVSVDGKVTTVASGYSDRERNRQMTPSDRMLVGSATKPFFAYVALSLAAEGKLPLDTPVARWLGAEPWFPRLPNASQLTMRHLLAHRGGLVNHAGDSAFAGMVRAAGSVKLRQGFTPEEQIAFALDQPARFGVGEGFSYSDTGYLIAALALEKAIGRTYYQELQSRVLGPLHLAGTSPSTHPDLPGLTQGYHRPPVNGPARGFALWGLPEHMVVDGRLVMNPVFEWTGGGLISTSADLARWIETLFESSPWKAVGDSMVSGLAPGAIYGLGIFVRQTPDGLMYWHPGGFPGYHTEVAYVPDLGVGIAFQTNTDRVDGAAVLHALIAEARRGKP